MAAGVELGLEVAFYLYPCGLFLTLLGSQAVEYRREKQRENSPTSENSVSAEDEKDADKIRTRYAWLIWLAQILLSTLLVCFCLSLSFKIEC